MPSPYSRGNKAQRGKKFERGVRVPRDHPARHDEQNIGSNHYRKPPLHVHERRAEDLNLGERYIIISDELRVARKELREHAQAAQTKVAAMQKELTTTQAHAMSLMLEMQTLKTRLAVNNEEPEAGPLLAAFDSLNSQILQFALSICCMLDATDLRVALHRSSIDAFLERQLSAIPLLGTFLTEAADAAVRVQDVLAPLAQAIVTGTIIRTIFVPFAPGLAGTIQDSLLMDLGSSLEGTDAGRWRMLTYRAANAGRDDNTLASAIAAEVVEMLSELLRTVLPPGNFESGQLVDQHSAVMGLVLAALRWEDAVRGCSINVEYDVFMPLPGDVLIHSDMHPVELSGGQLNTKAQMAKRVLLPVSLGLRSTSLAECQANVLRQANVVGTAKV